MEEKFYITTAIPYMNSKLHLGQIYEFIMADIIARYNRLMEKDVYFLTGSDEHGQKIYKAAQQKGEPVQGYVDKMVEDMKRLLRLYHISNDGFIRTTDSRHEKIVQNILDRLKDNGDLYKGHYEGNYCIPCETFYTDAQIIEGKCPDCGRETEKIKEENYFFKLSSYQQKLIDHIEENPDFVIPETRKNEVLGLLKQGLKDISVTRTAVTWAVPVPFDDKHYCYVWVDALINYISALGFSLKENALFEKYWPADQHHIGKDILKFHTLIWPALLMSLGVDLPKHVVVHGWILLGEEKLSKSKGVTLDPDQLAQDYGVDAIRYFVAREISFGNDGSFTYDSLVKRYNGDLSNDIGNLVSRTVTMVNKFSEGKVPVDSGEDGGFKSEWENAKQEFMDHIENFKFTEALSRLWSLVNKANKYIEDTQPWSLAKSGDRKDKERLNSILYQLVETIRLCSLALYPFMPHTTERIMGQFGIKEDVSSLKFSKQGKWGYYAGGSVLGPKEILFPRIKEDKK